MQKLTPGTNKTIAILIRVVLLLTGGSAIIAGLCLFGGDMWMLTPRAEQYQPATGDLVDVVIYEPSKFFFALLYVFIITLIWLLAVRNIPWRPIQHPILALIILIAAGIVIFLHPEVTPGRDASIQYGKHNISYTAIFWSKT
ncbi:glycosyl transferase, partial [Klebsiella pneumoniae]